MNASPALSVIVVVFNMAPQFNRTATTLRYQKSIRTEDWELIVVDNGSDPALSDAWMAGHEGPKRHLRVDTESHSPVDATNAAIQAASGDLIALIIDGARMCSPGLLAGALRAHELAGDRSLVTAPAWHIGTTPQSEWEPDRIAAEERLLDSVHWQEDGYQLFDIATLAPSSGRGVFSRMGESSSLILHRNLWAELGGLDPRFRSPGGGLVNHDTYRRACEATSEVVVLLGEGTFHQSHGGASTSSASGTVDAFRAEYESIRREPYQPPDVHPTLIGQVRPQFLRHVARSAELALKAQAKSKNS